MCRNKILSADREPRAPVHDTHTHTHTHARTQHCIHSQRSGHTTLTGKPVPITVLPTPLHPPYTWASTQGLQQKNIMETKTPAKCHSAAVVETVVVVLVSKTFVVVLVSKTFVVVLDFNTFVVVLVSKTFLKMGSTRCSAAVVKTVVIV